MKLSEKLQFLFEAHAHQPLSIEMLLEQTGKQGFGLFSGLLVIPMLIPVPIPLAGFSTLIGLGIILLGLQLALGFEQPYLPHCITRHKIPPAISQAIFNNVSRILHPLEHLAQPRLLQFSRNSWPRRILGLYLTWNALLMALPLPIPFTNLLPAYTILVLAIGIFESDGVLILCGYGMTVITTLFFASMVQLIWALLLHILTILTR